MISHQPTSKVLIDFLIDVQIALDQGDTELAIGTCRSTMADYPDMRAFFTFLADRLFGASGPVIPVSLFLRDYLEEHPEELQLRVGLLFMEDQMDASRELEHFLDDVEGLVEMNMLAEASEQCLARAQAHPEDTGLLYSCAGTVSLGTDDQAARMQALLAGYLERHPSDPHIRLVFAVLRVVQKREAEALAEFAKVPDEQFRHAARWMWLQALLKAGNKRQIADWFANQYPSYAERLREEDPAVHLKFFWTACGYWTDQKQFELAAQGYEYLLERDPASSTLYLEYGRVLTAQGQKEKAAEIYRQGLRLPPAEIDGQNNYPGAINYAADEERQIWTELKSALETLRISD